MRPIGEEFSVMSEGHNKWDTTAYNNHFSLMLRIRRRGDNINCMISQPRFASIYRMQPTPPGKMKTKNGGAWQSSAEAPPAEIYPKPPVQIISFKNTCY